MDRAVPAWASSPRGLLHALRTGACAHPEFPARALGCEGLALLAGLAAPWVLAWSLHTAAWPLLAGGSAWAGVALARHARRRIDAAGRALDAALAEHLRSLLFDRLQRLSLAYPGPGGLDAWRVPLRDDCRRLGRLAGSGSIRIVRHVAASVLTLAGLAILAPPIAALSLLLTGLEAAWVVSHARRPEATPASRRRTAWAATALGMLVTLTAVLGADRPADPGSGTVLVIAAYGLWLHRPWRDVAELTAEAVAARAPARRAMALLDVMGSPDTPGPSTAQALDGRIDFEHVSFGYDPARPPILERLSLHVEAGERIALIGPSGAGKSTLLALLLRLHEPTAGRILIGGVDLRHRRPDELAQTIGVVGHDPLLLDISVRDNVALGKPGATDAEIRQAAADAGAALWIDCLPEGYDTRLGRDGAPLSRDQRQQLALARALVRRPSIVAIDLCEPGRDAKLVDMAAAAHAAPRGHTLLVLACDHTDLSPFDRVLALHAGRVIDIARPVTAATDETPATTIDGQRRLA